MFLLQSPHRGDSNEYVQYTIFNIKEKITLNFSTFAVMGFFPRDSRNGFETAVVNKPSVFEPQKFYCILKMKYFGNCRKKRLKFFFMLSV